MPQQETVYRIFVGSPSDVQNERSSLEDIIAELNLHIPRTLGVRFDLVKWETHIYPDVGEEAQDVINQQISNDYDIFLGIMWARVGTQTKTHESGTIEEFEKAYIRKKEIKIIFYFKNAPKYLDDIDPMQLQKLQGFKKDLELKRILYKSFNSLEEFANQIRINFNQLALDLAKQPLKQTSFEDNVDKNTSDDIGDSTIEEDDLGFFNFTEKGESNIATATESMEIISEEMELLGNKVREVTAQMNGADSTIGINEVKAFYAVVANQMVEFSDIVDIHLPIFSESYRFGLNCYLKAAEMSNEFGTKKSDIEGVLYSVKVMKDSTMSLIPIMEGFRGSVVNVQRATSKINVAKRKVINSMDSLINDLNRNVVLSDDALEFLKRLIDSLQD